MNIYLQLNFYSLLLVNVILLEKMSLIVDTEGVLVRDKA